MSRQHSNEYICRNVIGGYYTCEIIRTCDITSTFVITKLTKVTLVSASYNQCVMHTKPAFSKFGRHVCQADVTPVQDMKSLQIFSNENRESKVACIKKLYHVMKYIKYCITLDRMIISKALLAVDVAAERVL